MKLKKTGARIPVVLSTQETQQLFDKLDQPNEVPRKTDGRYGLPARLQYGAGLRRSELVRLRIKDVDLERGTVTVRQGKGDKDRITMMPKTLRDELAVQIEKARAVWQKDREAGLAGVHIKGALSRKFRRASETFEWFWLFPARQVSVDPECGIKRRYHLHATVYNDAVKRAAQAVGIEKRVTSHALRNVFSYCYICLRTLYSRGNSGCKSFSGSSWRPSLTANIPLLTFGSERELRSMVHGVVGTN